MSEEQSKSGRVLSVEDDGVVVLLPPGMTEADLLRSTLRLVLARAEGDQ